ncbi:elongation factor EF-2 [Candidatus Micrarchaeota archaeon]|nr:elongation factor EF-2 [Candidatus Micrarchaeota archaeon]
MARKETIVQDVSKLMGNRPNIRNMGIVAHIDHGKTTLSDSLIALAGMISTELAGEQRALDYDQQEQARGITIKSANVSIPYAYEGQDYLINLIDTPGHVDFGGHVTRAMRAVDGVVLVIDAVEGIMPQTETVLRQALKEKVKPVLFINKIDRLINELKLDSKGMQDKFMKVIMGVNKLIKDYASEEFKEVWQIEVMKGNVVFGTAFHKWAVSGKQMKKSGMTFKDIYQACADENHKELEKKLPIGEVLMDVVIQHLPNPLTAQTYRIPVIWKGDLESESGKAMMTCDANGRACFMVTAIQVDPHAGEVAVGRLYAGTLHKSQELYLASQFKHEKLQQVAVYMGQDRIMIDEVPAGNIVALVGLKEAFSGETVSEGELIPFEEIKHHSVPVVTKSIEAKNPRDLVRLIDSLKKLAKEDPTLRVEIDQDTGEHLISGMGELHLEIIEFKIRNEKKVDIVTSPPIVVYNETLFEKGPILEGKSPNKHNKFKMMVEPMEEGVLNAMNDGTITSQKKGKELQKLLIEAGLPRDEARSVIAMHNSNLFLDMTKGVQYLKDIQESIVTAFQEAMVQGPLAKEKCVGVKVKLTDAAIHVDPAHRGPAQLFPAIKRPIYAGMLHANCVLMEPKQNLFVNAPAEYLSNITLKVQGRRGQVTNIEQEGEAVAVVAKVPVSEMFGFANEIRGATQGRAVWYYEYAGYEKLPRDLQSKIVQQIRKRKGDSEIVPTAKDFLD